MKKILFVILAVIIVGLAVFLGLSLLKNKTNRETAQKMLDALASVEKLPTLKEEDLDNQIKEWQKIKDQSAKAVPDIEKISVVTGSKADVLKEEIIFYYDAQFSDHLNELKTLAYLNKVKKDLVLPPTSNQEDAVKEMGALQSRIENLMMSATFALGPEFNDKTQKARQEFESFYKSVQENYEKAKKGEETNLDASKVNLALDDLGNDIKKSLTDYINQQNELDGKIKSFKNNIFNFGK